MYFTSEALRDHRLGEVLATLKASEEMIDEAAANDDELF